MKVKDQELPGHGLDTDNTNIKRITSHAFPRRHLPDRLLQRKECLSEQTLFCTFLVSIFEENGNLSVELQQCPKTCKGDVTKVQRRVRVIFFKYAAGQSIEWTFQWTVVRVIST